MPMLESVIKSALKNHLLKNILRPSYRLMLKGMTAMERRMLRSDRDLPYPPIFIIGVPRSGTTLLYQLITRSLEVAYLSNLMAEHYDHPCTISYCLSRLDGCTPPDNYKSSYGETAGWRAPSQGWQFWARWFPGDQGYVGRGEISSTSRREMRNTIGLIEKIYGRPFVNKNLSLGVRLQPLNEAFPEALFIRIQRDRADNAQSLLKGRKEYTGDINNWISVKPSAYEMIKGKDPITQVCEQIYYLEDDINRDIRLIGEDRCLNLSYTELCQEPREVIEKIMEFYEQKARTGVLKKKHDPPAFFDISSGKKCRTDEYARLKESLANLYGSGKESF